MTWLDVRKIFQAHRLTTQKDFGCWQKYNGRLWWLLSISFLRQPPSPDAVCEETWWSCSCSDICKQEHKVWTLCFNFTHLPRLSRWVWSSWPDILVFNEDETFNCMHRRACYVIERSVLIECLRMWSWFVDSTDYLVSIGNRLKCAKGEWWQVNIYISVQTALHKKMTVSGKQETWRWTLICFLEILIWGHVLEPKTNWVDKVSSPTHRMQKFTELDFEPWHGVKVFGKLHTLPIVFVDVSARLGRRPAVEKFITFRLQCWSRLTPVSLVSSVCWTEGGSRSYHSVTLQSIYSILFGSSKRVQSGLCLGECVGAIMYIDRRNEVSLGGD